MKKLILILGIILSFYACKKSVIQDKEKNFKELQVEYSEHYDSVGIDAPGWKQFKRWEWYWESRVDKSGEFPIAKLYPKDSLRLKAGFDSWRSLGPANTNGGYAGLGRVNCIAFKGDSTLFIGAASGGLWKSTDLGLTWDVKTDNNAVLGVSDIAIDGDWMYIATGDKDAYDNYSVGVLMSTNGGESWYKTELDWSQKSTRTVNRLIMNGNYLYVATSIGVYKMYHGRIKDTLTNIAFIDMEASNGILYGSTRTGGEVYVSDGNSWNCILNTNGTRTEIAVNGDVVYAIVSNSNNGLEGIYKATDGYNFIKIHSGTPNMLGWNCDGSDEGGQGWYDLCIAVDSNNADRVVIGGVNTWLSEDGGSTWNIFNHWSSSCGGVARVIHADKHNLIFNGSTLFECNDGGVYYYDDFWHHIGDGLVISQVYRLGVSQINEDIIIGLQDNGTKVRYNTNWYDIIGGDGMECIIDPTDINIQYGELYYGQIRRTHNLWGNYVTITGNITGQAAWVTPYVLDPTNYNVVYVGYQDLWRRDFGNDTGFHKISNLNGATLRSIAVVNSQLIYMATMDNIYKTVNGGDTWEDLGNPSNSTITYLCADEDKLWITCGQFNKEGVYEYDGTWKDISDGLPEVPINCIISEDILYVGTDIGVYFRKDGWTRFKGGLPNVVITELETRGNKIVAATYGRGIWEADLIDLDADVYCIPYSVDNFIDGIDSVRIDDWEYSTGNSKGYGNYSSNLNLTYDTRYMIRLNPQSRRSRYYWRIWIDLNIDGDFEDEGETVYRSNNKRGIRSEEIILTSGEKYYGATRMRIMMKKASQVSEGYILPCDDDFNGEVEDYEINLIK